MEFKNLLISDPGWMGGGWGRWGESLTPNPKYEWAWFTLSPGVKLNCELTGLKSAPGPKGCGDNRGPPSYTVMKIQANGCH